MLGMLNLEGMAESVRLMITVIGLWKQNIQIALSSLRKSLQNHLVAPEIPVRPQKLSNLLEYPEFKIQAGLRFLS